MPERRPFIAGNWKLWGTRAQTAEYCERLLTLLPDASRRPADVGLCVPYTALDTAVQALEGSGVLVAAQNMARAGDRRLHGRGVRADAGGAGRGRRGARPLRAAPVRQRVRSRAAGEAAGRAGRGAEADPLRRRDRGRARGR